MKKSFLRLLALLLTAAVLLAGCGELALELGGELLDAAVTAQWEDGETASDPTESEIREDGNYTDKEGVAQYLLTYGHLPDNFITKAEAKKLGWDSKQGNLQTVAPGKSIGGDRFGNYEELLPEKPGREYRECDIDYTGGHRNGKRIVFSNDGLIFYTEDHYESFEQLYGEE